MSTTSRDETASGSELRYRLPQEPAIPQKAGSADVAKQSVTELNEDEEKLSEDDGKKRTYGRTTDGTG